MTESPRIASGRRFSSGRELRRGHRKVCEERRILNVCAFRIPFVDASARAFYFLPAFGAAHIGVAFFEHFAFDVCGDRFRDFLRRRPNVGEENVFAFLGVFAMRFSVEVDVDPSRRARMPPRAAGSSDSWLSGARGRGLQNFCCPTARLRSRGRWILPLR